MGDPVNVLLTEIEVRVLGSLVEKDATTPDYYPLSINALVNACNQKSNRDPFMTLTEDAVRQALASLKEKKLAGPVNSADSRVTKYEHRMQEAFNFSRGENAVLCVLMLRGAQTPGELRGRTERIHSFEDLDEVQSALQKLMQRDPPLVQVLQRQPGTKESRYMHLLCGLVEPFVMPEPNATPRAIRMDNAERLEKLEETVAGLQKDVEDLKQQFASFRRQFE
jgi:uncharacterized protein YceH (UPF0502 family)